MTLYGGHSAASSKAAVLVELLQKEIVTIMKVVLFLGLGHRMFNLMKSTKLIRLLRKQRSEKPL